MAAPLAPTESKTYKPSQLELEDTETMLRALIDDWERTNNQIKKRLVKYERDRGVMIRMYFRHPSKRYVCRKV